MNSAIIDGGKTTLTANNIDTKEEFVQWRVINQNAAQRNHNLNGCQWKEITKKFGMKLFDKFCFCLVGLIGKGGPFFLCFNQVPDFHEIMVCVLDVRKLGFTHCSCQRHHNLMGLWCSTLEKKFYAFTARTGAVAQR